MKHSSAYRPNQPRGRVAGFTLVEMLGVITILGILTVLTVLGVRGVNGSTSRRAAVGTLMGVFDQARMTAISDGRPTYVVFVSTPTGQSQPNATALPDTMWGEAYAMFEDGVITDAATTLSTSQRSGWMFLPPGVAFKANDNDGSPDSVTSHSLASYNDPTTFLVRSRTGNTSVQMTLPYIKFDPTGQIVDNNNELLAANDARLRVMLFSGAASNAGAETLTKHAVLNSSGANYALDEIDLKPTTGRAQYIFDPVNNATPSR